MDTQVRVALARVWKVGRAFRLLPCLLFTVGLAAQTSQPLDTGGVFGVHRDGPFPKIDTVRVRWIFAQAADVGAQWMRINVPWDWAQPVPGRYDWRGMDLVTSTARESHISLVATLRGFTQCHNCASDESERIREYASFVHQAVARYHAQIHYWQIENEVTAPSMWHASLDEYVKVVRRASTEIKYVDPSAKVVLAGMGSAFLERLIGVGDQKQVDRARREYARLLRGVRPYVDVVDVHLYHSDTDIPERVAYVQKALADAGLDVPIWATEAGGPPRIDHEDVPPNDVAYDVPRRYMIALGAGVSRVFWHQIVGNSDTHSLWSHMALVIGTERRPAFTAYRTMTRLLGNVEDVKQVSLGTGISAYAATGPHLLAWVIWARKDTTISVKRIATPGDTVLVTDVWGDSLRRPAAAVRAGPEPVFVTLPH